MRFIDNLLQEKIKAKQKRILFLMSIENLQRIQSNLLIVQSN